MNAETAAPIVYTVPPSLGDDFMYELSGGAPVGRFFSGDPVTAATIDDLPRLASSPQWEDRIRAELVRVTCRVTMPDQFPCIYETEDSPNRAALVKGVFVWVASPDIDMLRKLLPDYQELWDSYTAKWGPTARRTMAVGRLDHVSPHGVFRPGTTPAQVIAKTMRTHGNMRRTAPERLLQMDPQYAGM